MLCHVLRFLPQKNPDQSGAAPLSAPVEFTTMVLKSPVYRAGLLPAAVWFVMFHAQNGAHLSWPQMPSHMAPVSTYRSWLPPPTMGGEAHSVQPPCTNRLACV